MLDGARDAQNNMRAFADVQAMGKVVDVPAARGDLILFSNLVMHGKKAGYLAHNILHSPCFIAV